MQFGDSETQRLLRNTARSYLADNYPWERLYDIESGKERLTEADLEGFANLGWFGLLAPESAGAGGASLLEAAVVIEEFGYAGVPAPVSVGNVAAALLSSVADSSRVGDLLASLAAGKRVFAVNEATRRRSQTQSARAPDSLAASDGRLSGLLPMVPFADIAHFVLTPLALDGEPAFVAVSLEGAQLQQVKVLDRVTYANARFQGADLQPSVVLATGKNAEALHERCDALVTGFALIELAGMMQRILEMTAEYITQRVQFGQPIAKFQAARHRAAELLMQTETTRWAAYHALWRLQESPSETEELWLAKHWAVRAADRVYQISHLLHGGVGVGSEYPLHLFTQGVAAFAVRGGAMNELVDRTIESIRERRTAGTPA